jgi:hypothetical protein
MKICMRLRCWRNISEENSRWQQAVFEGFDMEVLEAKHHATRSVDALQSSCAMFLRPGFTAMIPRSTPQRLPLSMQSATPKAKDHQAHIDERCFD